MWMLDVNDPSRVEQILQLAFAGQFVELDCIDVTLRAAAAAPQQDYFTQLLDVQVFLLAKGDLSRGRYAVSFTYDPLCVRAMRALGGYFHKHASAWQVRATPQEIQERLKTIAGVAPEFVFVHEQPVVIEELASTGNQGSPISVPSAPPQRWWVWHKRGGGQWLPLDGARPCRGFAL